MSPVLPWFVALTLVVTGAVAALPEVVAERQPRQRPFPSLPVDAELLRIVQAPGDRWYLNGAPIARSQLAERLGRGARRRQVRFLPSAALPMATVGASLRWLRHKTPGAVALELLPPR